MSSSRYFVGNTRRDISNSSRTRETNDQRIRDTGSGYNPVSHKKSQEYANEIRNHFMNINDNKSINKAFDVIQHEKNYLIKHGNIRGKHAEIYNILDRLQDAVLDENQLDIADITSSVRIASRTSQLVRESLDSVLGEMANTRGISSQRNNDQIHHDTRQNQAFRNINQGIRDNLTFPVDNSKRPEYTQRNTHQDNNTPTNNIIDRESPMAIGSLIEHTEEFPTWYQSESAGHNQTWQNTSNTTWIPDISCNLTPSFNDASYQAHNYPYNYNPLTTEPLNTTSKPDSFLTTEQAYTNNINTTWHVKLPDSYSSEEKARQDWFGDTNTEISSTSASQYKSGNSETNWIEIPLQHQHPLNEPSNWKPKIEPVQGKTGGEIWGKELIQARNVDMDMSKKGIYLQFQGTNIVQYIPKIDKRCKETKYINQAHRMMKEVDENIDYANLQARVYAALHDQYKITKIGAWDIIKLNK